MLQFRCHGNGSRLRQRTNRLEREICRFYAAVNRLPFPVVHPADQAPDRDHSSCFGMSQHWKRERRGVRGASKDKQETS